MEQDNKRLWLWAAGCIVILAMLVALVWIGRPHYRRFKEHRFQVEAQAFLARGDYRNAQISARQTLELDPANAGAWKVMATLADLARNPITFDYLQHVVQAEPTIDNQLLLATAALRYQNPPFPLTQQILNQLAPVATNMTAYQVLSATLAVSLHQLDAAENHFEAAARLEPTNQFHQLNLAVVRLGMTNESKAVQARAVLEKLRNDPQLGPAALRALIVDRLLHKAPAEALDFSSQLLASRESNLADQLQQVGILRQLKSGVSEVRLETLQRQAATNGMAVVQIASWMLDNGLAAEDIHWLTNLPAGTRNQSPVRAITANAYLANSDWKGLRDFASAGNWQELEFLRLAFVSRAWSELGVQAVAESNWGSAVNEAGSQYGALNTLLDLAERWNLERERLDLLKRIFEKFPRESWVWQALQELYVAKGNTAGLNELYARQVSLFPENLAARNNLAYTCLLLKTNLPNAYKWAAEVYTAEPNDPVAVSTYAFALHLQRRSSEGLALMEKLDSRYLHQPDNALLYGVLLGASGRSNEAAPFLKVARTKTDWLPEEENMLSAAQGH